LKFTKSLKDDCIGKYKIYRYKFEDLVTQKMINGLKEYGELKVYNNFPKPYFSIKSKDIIIKGILNENELEVTFFEYDNNILPRKFETNL